ncbi:MAG TPA: tRNA (adenosine(37)-N6)-dimethylallyltransferase MiaA, partial [Candidatus Saccharimonadales bacterium]|nr:tRNA (adenosine(37)-N6)-dimethylallyltransferase MiaA [Candidatus Saccharimonadales bacterium]
SSACSGGAVATRPSDPATPGAPGRQPAGPPGEAHPGAQPAGPLAALVGPTAVGKTEVALELAGLLEAEILSVDSRQVFRGLDIGTAKPSAAERARVPHHLVDLIEPGESLSAGEFRRRFDAAEAELRARGVRALAVGGSGLYLRAVTHGLFEGPPARADLRAAWQRRSSEELHAELAAADPEAAARLSPRDRQRVVRALEVFHTVGRPLTRLHRERPGAGRPMALVGLERPREELYARIGRRVDAMVAAGLEQEARRLWELRLPPGAAAVKTVGYREWFALFEGRAVRDQVVEDIRRHTRQYAKRQLTWFRAQPGIRWLPGGGPGEAGRVARRAFEELQKLLDPRTPRS